MVLVDTSVWIYVLGSNGLSLEEYVNSFDDEVVTCPPVIQEVLQGFRDERAYRIARTSLFALPVLESPMGAEVFEEAAQLYRVGRRSGFTIRSAFDCLIAACAIRNAARVLHCDRDFDALARVSTLSALNIAV